MCVCLGNRLMFRADMLWMLSGLQCNLKQCNLKSHVSHRLSVLVVHTMLLHLHKRCSAIDLQPVAQMCAEVVMCVYSTTSCSVQMRCEVSVST